MHLQSFLQCSNAVASTGTVPTDQWSHVAVTYSRGNFRAFYINGQKDSQSTNAPALGAGWGNYIMIGDGYQDANADRNGNYKGAIDEVRLWNRARSASEIAADLGFRLRGDEPGLIGYWRFDDGAGAQLSDASSSANHGRLLGGPRWVTSSAPVSERPGISRSSIEVADPPCRTLSMDGLHDYVKLTLPTATTWNAVTIEAWICPAAIALGVPGAAVFALGVGATWFRRGSRRSSSIRRSSDSLKARHRFPART
jgi:hypothetical protein